MKKSPIKEPGTARPVDILMVLVQDYAIEA
jgi:hypothetical protein